MNISDLSLELEGRDNNIVESVTPGQSYTLKASVTDNQNNVITEPNYKDFDIICHEFENEFNASWRIILKAHPLSFHQLDNPFYTITLSVKNNPYEGDSFSFPVNWNKEPVFDLRGRKGSDGQDGNNGWNRGNSDGEDGSDGFDGRDGFDGSAVDLLHLEYDIRTYNWDIETLVFIYNLNTGQYFLTKQIPTIINVSGGDGGDGGDITIYYLNPSLLDNIIAISEGGNPGEKGESGEAVFGSFNQADSFGSALWSGLPGSISYKQIDREKMLSFLKQIKIDEFDLENVIY